VSWEIFSLPDADVRLQRAFLSPTEATRLLNELLSDTPWRQDTISFYGKEHLLPRLQQWYGDEGLTYTWSGIHMAPIAWSPTLLHIKRLAEEAAGTPFNTVLLNHYRLGSDSVSWHADDEEELGEDPVIASVSLGAERDFMLRHIERRVDDITIPLPHGSLLVMAGATQSYWKHSLPRRKRVTVARVNLTFRYRYSK
jgi:alkylated DNA repair dioxygenase AlkB